ncbi:hypothetical protein Bbelb_110800 [Branchiostoma belcheri]|nr:hypothetical protein Bbelb_110800 [Branchiostoma belcheri]
MKKVVAEASTLSYYDPHKEATLQVDASKVRPQLVKPLEPITRKPRSSAPARLQRMLLRLQKYDLLVQHRPGKEIPVAAAMSRRYLEETDDMSETLKAQVHMVTSNLPVSSRRMEEVRRETREDSQLVALKGTIGTN